MCSGFISKPEPIITIEFKKYFFIIFSSSSMSKVYGSACLTLHANEANFFVSVSRNLSITPTSYPAFLAERANARPELAIIRYLIFLLGLALCSALTTINFLPLYFHF